MLRAEVGIGGDELITHTLDLSDEGVVVQVDRDAPLGSPVELALSFPGLLERCEMPTILVARRLATGPGAPASWELQWSPSVPLPEPLAELLDRCRNRDASEPAGFRILLVEDSALTRQVFELALVKLLRGRVAGIELDAVEDGEVALSRLDSKTYDLIIVDCMLPGIPGDALISRLRADARLVATPMIAMSVGGDAIRQAALAAGADFFVQKPLVVTDLLTTVEKLSRVRELS